MAPIPETSQLTSIGDQWMAMALGAVLTACVALSIALIVVLCGSGGEKEDAPPPAGEAPAEAPKEPSNKEAPAPAAEGGSKKAPSVSTAPSAKGPELKLTSEKAKSAIGGKSAKGPGIIDLKKQPSLQLQNATAKK